MMGRRRFVAAIVSVWCAGSVIAANSAAAPASQASRESTVILLSWDGLRHDFPDKGNFPGLLRMEQTGVRANRLIPVFPSNTFPGHVSIATGTYPDRHGIVDNHFFAREEASWYHMSSDANWIRAEPLWIAAERQGVATATYFWVGSESDWHGQGTRYRIAPFDGRRPEHKKVDQILAWLHLPEAERPRLIMSYWAGADSVAHRHGPDSPEVVTQLTLQDVQLQRLLAGLDALDCWAMTTLILVSDHGMATNSQFIDLTKVFADANIEVEVVGVNPAHVFVEDQNLSNRAGSVLRKLDRVTVYRGLEFPAEMRLGFPDRIGDWVVVTEPPYSFARLAPGSVMGMHGYNPLLDEMGASFLALGRGIASDLEIADVHQIDVAATVTLLLGIDPPLHSEGRAIPGIGVRTLSDVESCQ